jgi:hypothetical protein
VIAIPLGFASIVSLLPNAYVTAGIYSGVFSILHDTDVMVPGTQRL